MMKKTSSIGSAVVLEVFSATIVYLALTATLLYPVVEAAGWLA